MSDREALLRVVCEHPDDDTPRLVFADWLQENGEESRAEFIWLQCRPEAERTPADAVRETELLKAHRAEWTAPLKEFEGNRTGDYYEFRRGFVEGIASDGEIMVGEGEQVFALAPIRCIYFADEEEYDALAKCAWLLRLHTLDLKGSGLSNYFDPAPLLGSPYLANLTTLGLGGEDDNGHLDYDGIQALLGSKHLGKLESLDLSGNWLGQSDPGTFAYFLTGTNLPSLRSLNLAHVGIGTTGAVALAGTPWVAQLRILDLANNGIGEPGARALAASPLLRGIEMLDLRGNRGARGESEPISAETRQALLNRFGARVLL